ncbi:hypothetical protein [Halorubrum tebenquichense]|uniref:Uncharacterized protein n=1 Tax=Halorubrum tebenquichense DSM 14210 TaxID=1227485 RepID=M0DVW0_9EURY|nr:hypothetical protein [Halorubrum tebenquichense]ELZ39616.1 hypothetical protein C472_04858 [Halorubrum tebenquichense DSM 14210]
MEIGFDLGANVPSGVFALHAAVAVVFLYFAAVNGANGETVGLALYLAIAGMVALVGLLAGRIVSRR